MKFNKKLIYILSVTYLFFYLGINNYAFCNCLCNTTSNSLKKVSCSCCCEHKNCNCIKNKNIPYNNKIQSSINPANYTSYIENIYASVNPIFRFASFENISNYKFQTKHLLALNKNLEILRTVILLD